MEYSLRQVANYNTLPYKIVLILILMEYSLRPEPYKIISAYILCLNPYSNGI